MPALFSVFPDNCDAYELAAAIFKSGFERTWQACASAHPELGNALVDSRDFLCAASARAADLAADLVAVQPLDCADLTQRWLTRRGLKSLLDASQRWHLWHAQSAVPGFAGHVTLLPVLGNWLDSAGHTTHEILTWPELAAEGAAMHHCVADYWEECVTAGTRIFHLAAADGARATAAYRRVVRADAVPGFELVQLRGPCNAMATDALEAASRAVLAAIEIFERAEARQRVAAQAHALRNPAQPPVSHPLEFHPPVVSLDPASERELIRLLRMPAARVISAPARVDSTQRAADSSLHRRQPLQAFYRRRAFFASHPEHANGRHPCPACGYPTLPSEDSHHTCPVCDWEDDWSDDHNAGTNNGCNGQTLAIARENFDVTGCFAAGLDQGILESLARLDAHRTWSSCRNYNRLVAGETGRRRQQAVDRFPVLAAPVLLTAHHDYDTCGGKRDAWRNHDDTVVEAVEHGRDLAGALAVHYGVSRGLVRAPVCAAMWGDLGIAHTRMAHLLDRIPAHARPQSRAELERGAPYLVALDRLVGEIALADVMATLIQPGWTALWSTLEVRHAPLANAIADCRDFLRMATARALELDADLDGDDATLGHAWLARHGLASLLAASARWHRRPRRAPDHAFPARTAPVPALFGVLDRNLSIARELLDYDALVDEGGALHHCAASYWRDIVEDGTRIVSLRLPKGERATAQYDPEARGGDLYFRLVQLRGPCNADASYLMQLFARDVEIFLNAPEQRPARIKLKQGLDSPRPAPVRVRPAAAWLDAESERRLASALVWLRAQRVPPLAPGELLFFPIAGYAHYRTHQLEARFAPGQALHIAREPDNPHDPMAVRIGWQGQTLGYLPRPFNLRVARRLDAGEALACRVARIHPERLPWERVECVVSRE